MCCGMIVDLTLCDMGCVDLVKSQEPGNAYKLGSVRMQKLNQEGVSLNKSHKGNH